MNGLDLWKILWPDKGLDLKCAMQIFNDAKERSLLKTS